MNVKCWNCSNDFEVVDPTVSAEQVAAYLEAMAKQADADRFYYRAGVLRSTAWDVRCLAS